MKNVNKYQAAKPLKLLRMLFLYPIQKLRWNG